MPLSILLLCISEYRLAVTIARNIDYVSNGAPRMLIYPLNEHDQIDRRLNFRVGYMPPQPSVYKCPNRARRHSLRTPWGSESSTNIRNRDREIGRGEAVLQRYERITFEKTLIGIPGKPLAAFVCPGHPLLDATLDLIIERHRDLLKRGAVLIDDTDDTDKPRALLYLEHSIQDARTDRAGHRRIVSKRLQFVEVDDSGNTTNAGPAPYLDYRLPTDDEAKALAAMQSPDWIRHDLESRAMEHAAIHLVPQHLEEVRRRKEELLDKTKAAVQDRLARSVRSEPTAKQTELF